MNFVEKCACLGFESIRISNLQVFKFYHNHSNGEQYFLSYFFLLYMYVHFNVIFTAFPDQIPVFILVLGLPVWKRLHSTLLTLQFLNKTLPTRSLSLQSATFPPALSIEKSCRQPDPLGKQKQKCPLHPNVCKPNP